MLKFIFTRNYNLADALGISISTGLASNQLYGLAFCVLVGGIVISTLGEIAIGQ